LDLEWALHPNQFAVFGFVRSRPWQLLEKEKDEQKYNKNRSCSAVPGPVGFGHY
jgi:D-hexose-6-phosphate mutarotase